MVEFIDLIFKIEEELFDIIIKSLPEKKLKREDLRKILYESIIFRGIKRFKKINISDLKDMKSDLYDEKKDNPSFKDLLKAGIVEDKYGRVKCVYISEREIETKKESSIRKIGRLENGYFDVWLSNIQVCIRKCDVEGALKSVIELSEGGFKFLDVVVEKLCKVIPIEDIGCSNPFVIKDCDIFYRYYIKKKSKDEFDEKLKEKLIGLIVKLSDSKKSRLIANIMYYFQVETLLKTRSITKSLNSSREFDVIFEEFKNKMNIFLSEIDDKSIEKLECLLKLII